MSPTALNVLVFSFWKQAYVCQTIVDSFCHFIGIACIAYKLPSFIREKKSCLLCLSVLRLHLFPPFILPASLVLLSDQDTCRFCLRQFLIRFFLVLLAVFGDHVSYVLKNIWLASTWSIQSRRHPFSRICCFVNVELQ